MRKFIFQHVVAPLQVYSPAAAMIVAIAVISWTVDGADRHERPGLGLPLFP